MKINPLLILFLLLPLAAATQDSAANPSAHRLIFLSGAAYTAAMVGVGSLWYGNSERQPFTFFNDWPEWKQVDKAGHFFTAFHLSAGTARLVQKLPVQARQASLYGALTGFCLLIPIEVLDGFSADYGASLPDLGANLAGSAFFYAQAMLWQQVRIHPKFSFHRTPYPNLRNDATLGNSLPTEILKDYNGQTYWLSVDISRFVHFPKWLNLAAGYGATGMVFGREFQNRAAGYRAYRQIYMGPDIDLSHIKSRSRAINTLLYFINLIKLPAPALELSAGRLKWHWVMF